MGDEKLIQVAKPGMSVADQVKEAQASEQRAKQMIAMKQQRGQQLGRVIDILLQTFAVDEDNAVSTCLDYAVNLAQATNTAKEDVLKGFERLWDDALRERERVKEEQRKQVTKVAENLMKAKQPIPPPLVSQLKAMDCKISDDLQAWIDAASKPAEQAAEEKPAAQA